MNTGCTVGHCGHITRRTSCYINQLSGFHSTRTHVSVKSVPTVLTLVRNPCVDHHLDHSHLGCKTSRNYFLISAHCFPQLLSPYQYPSRHTESRSDYSSDLQCLGILLLAETPDVTFFASSRMKWFSVNLHVTHFITCESAESKCTRYARAATYIFSCKFIESA